MPDAAMERGFDVNALATEYIDAAIRVQVILGYDAPPANVRARAIRHAEKAIRQLGGLKP